MNPREQMLDTLSDEVEIPENGFDYLSTQIAKLNLPTLNLSILSERNSPVNKKDLWNKNETVGFQKYYTVKINGWENLDEKILKRIQIYKNGSQGNEWFDDLELGLNKKHISKNTLLKYVTMVYVENNSFIPKNKANEENPSTIDEACKMMFDQENKTPIHKTLKFNVQKRQRVDSLLANMFHWMKRFDFIKLSENAEEWKDYFLKLEEISKQDIIDIKKANYVGGLFQTYLRFETEKEKDETIQPAAGRIGQKISFYGKIIHIKKLSGVKTFDAFSYVFEDLSGNKIKWVTDKKEGFDMGTVHSISGNVKCHQVDMFTKKPLTLITHATVEKF